MFTSSPPTTLASNPHGASPWRTPSTACEQAPRPLDIEPARCVAVEDSFNGVRSGAAAGMRTIMVPDYNEPTPEIRALCAEVLTTLHELPAALDRLKTPNV